MALSVVRLSLIAGRHRARSAQVLGGLGVVWVLLAAIGAQLVPGVPVAGRDLAERLGQMAQSLGDSAAYERERAESTASRN